MFQLLRCSPKDLNLKIVLDCGQSFRWKQRSDNVWMGVLGNKLWLLKQTNDGILYNVIKDDTNMSNKSKETDSSINDHDFLEQYFQLKVDVSKLYKQWSQVDINFHEISTTFFGIRILKQDPVENLFSFICSQNNNINRIKKLVDNLCIHYGDHLLTYEGVKYYSFPEILKLSRSGVEEKLRTLGFGYRAKFIQQAAKYIEEQDSGVKWLNDLRFKSYEESHKALCSLPGVGPKVADCVCLMSLDKTEAIPVDTHMWQIAARDYLPHLAKNKNITDKAYKEVGHFFREKFGEYAGWAHSVLFSADLQKFKDLKNATQEKLPSSKRASKRILSSQSKTSTIKRNKKK